MIQINKVEDKSFRDKSTLFAIILYSFSDFSIASQLLKIIMNFFFKNPDLQNELNIYLSWFLCDWNMKQLFSSTNRCWSIFPPKQEIVVNHRSRQENRSP